MSSEILKNFNGYFFAQKRSKTIDATLHSKIERGDQEDSDGGVHLVRRSRADAVNEAI